MTKLRKTLVNLIHTFLKIFAATSTWICSTKFFQHSPLLSNVFSQLIAGLNFVLRCNRLFSLPFLGLSLYWIAYIRWTLPNEQSSVRRQPYGESQLKNGSVCGNIGLHSQRNVGAHLASLKSAPASMDLLSLQRMQWAPIKLVHIMSFNGYSVDSKDF